MAEKLGLGNAVRELKIGQSFTNPKSTGFHTVKYDFKPASVDTSKNATVEIGGSNNVTVTVPHSDGAGVPPTVYKGSQKPYQKECVLIINRVTGEITLEKLGFNIQVKKTRSEYNKLHLPHADRLSQSQNHGSSSTSLASERPTPSPSSSSTARAQTPPMVAARVSNKTRVASGSRRAERPPISQPAPNHHHHHHLVPKHSPLRASPGHPSPGRYGRQGGGGSTSPGKRDRGDHHHGLGGTSSTESHSQSTLASLPMIGIDDVSEPILPVPQHHQSSQSLPSRLPNPPPPASRLEQFPPFPEAEQNGNHSNAVGTISDSSSSSSSSDSDSEEDRGKRPPPNSRPTSYGGAAPKTNGYLNGSGAPKIDTHLLNDDLCLSESGSESE